MVDISLISLTPPQNLKPAQVSSGTEGQVLQTLPALENGTVLSGFILNRDAAGNPILRTESGDIKFASQFFLKIGAEVVIRIDATQGAPQQARILSVDGKPPEIAAQLSSFDNQPTVVLGQQHRPPNPLVSLNATVPADVAAAPAEDGITVFATLVKPAPAQAATPAAPLAPAAPATTTQTAPLAAQPAEPAALPNLSAGTQLTLKIVSITQAPAPAPAQASAAPAAPPQPPAAPAASYAAYARASGINTLPASAPPAAPAATTPTTPPAPPTPTAIPTATPAAAPPAITVPSPPQALPPATPATTVSPVTSPAPATALPASPAPTAAPSSAPAAAPVATPIAASTPEILGQRAPQAAPPAPSGPPPLQAQVVGHEPGGEALLQTPLGVVRLPPQTTLPLGSTLQFRLVQTTPAPLASLAVGLSSAQPISTQPAPLLELATQWTSLQQIVQLLSTRFGLTAGIPLSLPGLYTAPQNTPAFTPKDIGPGLLLFLSVMRGGDVRDLIGSTNAEWLEKNGYGNLLKKAQNEFASLGAQYAEPKPGNWQALFFPVAVDGLMQQVRLFVKRDRKNQPGSPQEKSEDTRFVLEVDLSQLGELQLDGFVRTQPREVQFDMVIRSLLPLSKEIQQDILSIYDASGAIAGFRGGLSFQHVREFPVSPMQDINGNRDTFTV